MTLKDPMARAESLGIQAGTACAEIISLTEPSTREVFKLRCKQLFDLVRPDREFTGTVLAIEQLEIQRELLKNCFGNHFEAAVETFILIHWRSDIQ